MNDIDNIRRLNCSVINTFVVLENVVREMGLVVNMNKTKFLISTKKTLDLFPLKIRTQAFETVNQFKYLGTLIFCCNDIF